MDEKNSWIQNHRMKSFAEGFHLEFICLFWAFSLYFTFLFGFLYRLLVCDAWRMHKSWCLSFVFLFILFVAFDKCKAYWYILRERQKSIKNSVCLNLHVKNGFAASVRCLIWWWQINNFSCGTHKINQHSDNLTWQSQSATASISGLWNTNRNGLFEEKRFKSFAAALKCLERFKTTAVHE